MNRSLTLLLALIAFKNDEDADAGKVTQITPDKATRFAFQKDADGKYSMVEISNQTGPQNDGKVEVIDATYLAADEIDVTKTDRALIVRMETTDGLTDDAIQAIGEAIEAYMGRNGCDQFATAAIHDIGQSQEMFGRWNTVVFTRDYDGKWSAKSIGFTSVQKSTDDTYAILRDGKLAKTDGGSIVSTLLDNDKLQALTDGSHQLDGSKKKHLVRAPINTGGAYAVIDENGGQTVYDDAYQVVASGKTPFVVMPAIDADGAYTDKVTTVSGKGNDWDVRRAIDPSKADGLGSAYGAAAA